jgi:hypothetical protein
MASNFKILVHRNSDNLHLQLLGDFDGSSAHQLVNALKKHGAGAYSVFIHTNGLKDIYPFGRDTFQNNLHNLNSQFFGSLIFTGEYAIKIAPRNSQIL